MTTPDEHGWMPIDTLPNDPDMQVLLAMPAGITLAPANLGNLTRAEAVRLYQQTGTWPQAKYYPTHWHALPKPPVSP